MSTNNTSKTCNAGDMLEAYTLAYEQMADTSAMLNAVSNEFKNLKNYLGKAYNIPDSCFNDLKRIIAITNTMIQESAELNQNLEQQYHAEYEESQA